MLGACADRRSDRGKAETQGQDESRRPDTCEEVVSTDSTVAIQQTKTGNHDLASHVGTRC